MLPKLSHAAECRIDVLDAIARYYELSVQSLRNAASRNDSLVYSVRQFCSEYELIHHDAWRFVNDRIKRQDYYASYPELVRFRNLLAGKEGCIIDEIERVAKRVELCSNDVNPRWCYMNLEDGAYTHLVLGDEMEALAKLNFRQDYDLKQAANSFTDYVMSIDEYFAKRRYEAVEAMHDYWEKAVREESEKQRRRVIEEGLGNSSRRLVSADC